MSRFAAPGGVPTAEMAAYYARRARHGCGLIIAEAATIANSAAGAFRRAPTFHGEALARWRPIVDAVHAGGGKIWPQLWHVGMHRQAEHAPWPEAPSQTPSGLDTRFAPTGEPMTLEEINRTIANYASAAADAKRMGFDGVQIHAAHGYLVDQFFWRRTNLRQDRFGGGVAERTRFAAEMVAAVRADVGADFPVSLRISQWKLDHYDERMLPDPEALAAFLAPLVAAGVDMFDCSQRRFWEPEFAGSDLNLAGWVKRLSGRPTITVGSVALGGPLHASHFEGDNRTPPENNLDRLVERLARDEFDLVAIGRSMIANPDWVEKVRAGRVEALEAFATSHLERLN